MRMSCIHAILYATWLEMGHSQYCTWIVAFLLVSLFNFMKVLKILKTCVQKLEKAVAFQILVAAYETPQSYKP